MDEKAVAKGHSGRGGQILFRACFGANTKARSDHQDECSRPITCYPSRVTGYRKSSARRQVDQGIGVVAQPFPHRDQLPGVAIRTEHDRD